MCVGLDLKDVFLYVLIRPSVKNFLIGQLPRVSTEDRDRVVSVFEFHLVCSLIVSKFSHFLYYKVL